MPTLRQRIWIGSRVFTSAALAVVLALLLMPIVALADDLINDLDGSPDTNLEVLLLTTADGGATIRVHPTSDDGRTGCNLSGTNSVTVGIQSTDTTVATVSPSSLTFDECSDTKSVTVTPVKTGTANIVFGVTGGTFSGSFNP